MEEQDLLALRFPSRVPVRFEVLEPGGKKVEGGPWPAQGLDVSRTGVRLEASGLPPALLKRLGDWESELKIEVSFAPELELPVVGVCRWMKDFGTGRWLLGIEYVPQDRSRGTAIAAHFERRYLRPKVVRMAGFFGSITVVFAAALIYGAWERQQRVVAEAEAELRQALEQKESLSILIAELESRLRQSRDGAAAPPDLAREIAALRTELEKVRTDVGKKSVALADYSRRAPPSNPARPFLERGNRFFSEGNMAAARLEYEKARDIDESLPEPYLKLGIVHEFQDRPVEALAAYSRYLELRRDAPDRVEVEGRVERLYRQLEAMPAAAAMTPLGPPVATPVRTPSPEELLAAKAAKALQEGHTHLQSERLKEAVRAYRTVVKDYSAFPDGHYWLAAALALQGEEGAACKEFRRYLELAPDGALAANARANVEQCD